jgi:hypothetical protein
MAIIEDIFEGSTVTGLAVGAGLLLLPVVTPLITGIARPLVKSVIKGGIVVYDTAREYLAEAGEYMSDITAEARAELAAGGTATAGSQGRPGNVPKLVLKNRLKRAKRRHRGPGDEKSSAQT